MAYRSLVPTVAASLLGASVVLAQPITLPSSRPAPRRAPLPASANVPGKRPVDRVLSAVGGNFAGAAGDFDERAGFADTRGVHHSRVVQKVKGVPVYGGEAIVHMRSDGSVDGVTDRLLRNVEAHLPSSLTPALTTAAAVTAAERAGGCSACLAPQRPAELFVLPTGESAKLAYRVELDKSASGTPSRPVVFVDAMTGATLRQYDNLQTGAGTTNYYGTVTLATTTSGDKRYLEDATTWRVGTFDAKNGTTSVVRAADPDDNFNDPSQKSLVDLHYGLTSTLAYLKTKHGWSGLDGSGGPGSTPSVAQPDVLLITGVAHYSVRYNNAFWNGTFIQCGDGDGTTFGPLTSLDIVAHEIGHAVIQFSSGLEYQGEPGALNESFADVLGALTERHAFGESADTWKMGEKAYTPANGTGDALRSLADPHVVGNTGFTTDDDPDHYSERYLGSSDNGGVHINSGIGNKAFYLTAPIPRPARDTPISARRSARSSRAARSRRSSPFPRAVTASSSRST